MMLYTTLIRQTTTKPKHALHSLSLTRSMGGGPRTFPGGLNKWQWKRLHEKKAREKEKRLLDQEKQLYQARLRSQIRSSVSGPTEPGSPGSYSSSSSSSASHAPMSPQEHIKALADRFVKDGAEDLWNDDDGPAGPLGPGPKEGPERGVDLRKVFGEVDSGGNGEVRGKKGYGGHFGGSVGNLQQRRGYCGNGGFFGGGFLGKVGSFCANLQQVRGFCGNSMVFGGGFLMDLQDKVGNLVKLESFGGNLQQKRGYLAIWKNENDELMLGGVQQRRGYGSGNAMRGKGKGKGKGKAGPRKWRKAGGSSSDDDDEDYGTVEGNARWPKFTVDEVEAESGDEGEGERGGGGRNVRAFMGNATLGKYDVKITKRRIMKELEDYAEREEEGDLSQSIEEIRQEFSARKLAEQEKEEKEKEKLPLLKSSDNEFVGSQKR